MRSFAHGAVEFRAHGVSVGRNPGGLLLSQCFHTNESLPDPDGLGRSAPYVFGATRLLTGFNAWYTFAVYGIIRGTGNSDIKSRPVPSTLYLPTEIF